MRQAGLVRLLEDWAESNNFEIIATATPGDRLAWSGCRMVIVNVGGSSVTDGAPQVWIRSVRTFMSDVPITILSDREDCGEIRAAFKAGVSGFIPATLEPVLAMEALTFLSRGGSFFPCSVLLEESQAVRENTSRALRSVPETLPPDRREYSEPQVAEYSVFEPAERPQPQTAMPNDGIRRHAYSEVRRTQVHIAARARVWDGPPPRVEESDSQEIPSLTPRQREVLQKLSEGKSNKLIARDLEMTEATVKVHVRQIMRKFGATNRTQAALCAMRISSIAMSRRAR